MFIDMHVHSQLSDDAGATVEGYLKWIQVCRRKGYRIDGMVLTEHRGYTLDADYSALVQAYGVLILRGSEIETDLGHVLVYGVTPALLEAFDFSNVALPAREVVQAVRELGGAAVAAHAGRPKIGLYDYHQQGVDLDGFQIIEQLNGGSNEQENQRAARLAAERGLFCVGGSDAHYVSAIGRCLTEFRNPIHSIEELVAELYRGEYRPARLEETQSA